MTNEVKTTRATTGTLDGQELPRYEIVIDGETMPDTYVTMGEAEAEAANMRHGPSQKIVVRLRSAGPE